MNRLCGNDSSDHFEVVLYSDCDIMGLPDCFKYSVSGFKNSTWIIITSVLGVNLNLTPTTAVLSVYADLCCSSLLVNCTDLCHSMDHYMFGSSVVHRCKCHSVIWAVERAVR